MYTSDRYFEYPIEACTGTGEHRSNAKSYLMDCAINGPGGSSRTELERVCNSRAVVRFHVSMLSAVCCTTRTLKKQIYRS